MHCNSKNPTPALCELEADISLDENKSIIPAVYLQVGSEELRISEIDYMIKLKNVFIGVDSVGYRLVPGTKFGVLKKPPFEEVLEKRLSESNIIQSQSADIQSGIGIGVSGAKISLAAKGSIEASEKLKASIIQETTEKKLNNRVCAIGGGKWKISEIGGEVLFGSYLNGEPLAKFERHSKSNQYRISIIAFCRQRDMLFERTDSKGISIFRQKAHEIAIKRISDIMKAKFISEEISPEIAYMGHIQLGLAEHEDE